MIHYPHSGPGCSCGITERMRNGRKTPVYILSFLSVLWSASLWPLLLQAQTAQDKRIYGAALDVAPVSKYIWRGQRLTNDWSLQTSGTLEIGGFSAGAWGNLDLTGVNPGDSLYLREDPQAPPGDHHGLRGKFSEVDYTFNYAHSLEKVALDVGAIVYTFPERSAALPSTTEIYAGMAFEKLPLSPSVKLFVDVDETAAKGDVGLYFLMGAGHGVRTGFAPVPRLEISGALSVVNGGFSNYYYSAPHSGAHDFNFTVSAPMRRGENWSLSPFLSYSALLGDFRNHQFRDPRQILSGTAGSPATYADTVYGGITLSFRY